MRFRFVAAFLSLSAAALWLTSAVLRADDGPKRPSLMGRQRTFHPPANLRCEGTWANGPTDVLTWSPVPDAVAYNVYLYDELIGKGIRDTTWVVPPAKFHRGLTYTVTAVNARGMESIPSAIAPSRGGRQRTRLAHLLKVNSKPVRAPENVVAVGEWNANAPRVRISWRGRLNTGYDLYRDGEKIASGLPRWYYLDADVKPGERHTYVLVSHSAKTGEEARSEAVTVVAPVGPPPFAGKVQIAGIVPNDDSVLVSFKPVPGAVDYRCYKENNPDLVKYSGGGLRIEINGIDPRTGADLIVEAVDKLGPFQKVDGEMGPGAMNMGVALNGQGDPSNVPNVLARSDVFHVTCRPRKLAGEQVFFDTFRPSQPFKRVKNPTTAIFERYGRRADRFREYENDRWIIRNHDGDMQNTRIFVMSDHFMDTTYDGGTPRGKLPLHTTNASLVMMPKATADISGGRVLHVTMEVDAHFSQRRWCDIVVGRADDPLIRPGLPGRDKRPTASGDLFRWEIRRNVHAVQMFSGGASTNLLKDPAQRRRASRTGRKGKPGLNGTVADLDRRSRFDLYLSQRHFRLMEEGQVVAEGEFPADKRLPFDRIQVYFIHQVYHTANDRGELIASFPQERYWIDHRPWADERHWDNMGFAVLTSMPPAPSSTARR